MTGPLTDLLREVRRTLRRAGLIRGAALFGLTLIAGSAVAGGLDFLIRPSGTAARLLFSLAAIAPAVWVVVTFLLPALRNHISDIELARRIESYDPRWRGRLAAATAFLKQDPVAGSTELQRRLIDDVSQGIASEPPPVIVDKTRLRKVVLAAIAVASLAFIFICASPVLARSGLLRLAMPLAAVEWPRTVELHLVMESGAAIGPKIQIGRGQTLRFHVRNRNGDVPNDLTMQVIGPDGGRRSEPVPIADEASSDGIEPEVGVGSLLAAEGPLRFRVVGGDHRNMPYVIADVVPPPVFERMIVTVTPPAYLQAEPNAPKTGGGAASGIVGSSVSFKGRANKPLFSAELFIGDHGGQKTTLSDDGRTVTAAFTLDQPGLSSYWFRLRDRGGFENPEAPRYELRVAADTIPAVRIVEPPDDVTATADADLPVVVEATDDHGLTSVRLRFNRDGLHDEAEGPDEASDSPGRMLAPFDGPERPLKGTYPLLWSLGPLELRPGDRLEFRGEATDAFDLGPPHVGRSSPRRITIVSASEKREELLDRQAELLDDLAQARRDEERVSETVAALLAQLAQSTDLPADQKDLLARSELEQRRISSQLADAEDGLKQRAARAFAELKSNRLEDSTLSDRLERIATELGVLEASALPAADRSMTAARKSESGDAALSALVAAKGEMSVVQQSLDTLLEDLGAWRKRRDLGIEANELLAIQRELREETAKTAAQTLGTVSAELTDQQTGALERLGQRQNGLADRMSRLAQTIERLVNPSIASGGTSQEDAGQQERITDSSADKRLEGAADLLRSVGMPATARAAGESIRGNNLGEAGRLQRELLSQLQALREILSQSDRMRFDEENLRTASNALTGLAETQEEILGELRQADGESQALDDETREGLIGDQAQLREDAAAAARNLRSATAHEAAGLVDDAVRQMAEGLERLRRREDDAAERLLGNARDWLRRAERQATSQADDVAQRLASERIASSVGKIESLVSRQTEVNDEVRRLDGLKRESGSLSRSQLLLLRKLIESQQTIATETQDVTRNLDQATIIAFALQSAVGHMERLETSLTAKETGPSAQGDGDAAKTRLDQVASALRRTALLSGSADKNDPSRAQGEEASGDVPRLVQLELLKMLQEDVYQRTQSLDDAHSAGEFSAAQREELKRLGVEQQSLFEMFTQLVNEATPAVEEASE
ncbi:MAG: hypothetical protein H0T47_22365 [Planctomycetaceae bacterium]|nr:hypothetical protein [Planctomycetaceae bacterium]